MCELVHDKEKQNHSMDNDVNDWDGKLSPFGHGPALWTLRKAADCGRSTGQLRRISGRAGGVFEVRYV